MNTENFSNSKPVLAYTPGALSSGDNLGLVIDTKGYRSLLLAIALTITTGEVDSISFQESSDNAVSDAYTEVDDSENLYYPDDFPLTGAAAFLVNVASIAKERYVKVNIVCSGTVSIALNQAIGQLQDSLVSPAVKEASVIADADVNSPGKTADAESTPPKRT